MDDSFPVRFIEALGGLVFALLCYAVVVIGIRKALNGRAPVKEEEYGRDQWFT